MYWPPVFPSPLALLRQELWFGDADPSPARALEASALVPLLCNLQDAGVKYPRTAESGTVWLLLIYLRGWVDDAMPFFSRFVVCGFASLVGLVGARAAFWE